MASSLLKEVYNPKAFFPHAASLRQAFAHCARFPTAASRRSLGRVSVPVWLIVLSDQLRIVALVGRYPRQQANPPRARPRPEAEATLFRPARGPDGASGINPSFPGLSRCRGLITHVLLTRSPLSPGPKPRFSLDLHVLSAPPAFVLSQDQTLREDVSPAEGRQIQHSELVLKVFRPRRGRDRVHSQPHPQGMWPRRKRTLLSFQGPSLRDGAKKAPTRARGLRTCGFPLAGNPPKTLRFR